MTAPGDMWERDTPMVLALRRATVVFLFLVSMPVTVVRRLVVVALALTLGFMVTGGGRGRRRGRNVTLIGDSSTRAARRAWKGRGRRRLRLRGGGGGGGGLRVHGRRATRRMGCLARRSGCGRLFRRGGTRSCRYVHAAGRVWKGRGRRRLRLRGGGGSGGLRVHGRRAARRMGCLARRSGYGGLFRRGGTRSRRYVHVRRRRARRSGSRRRRRGTGGRRGRSWVPTSGPARTAAAATTPGHASGDDVRSGRGCGTLGYCDTSGQVRQQVSRANQLIGHGVLRGAGIHNGIRVEAALVLEHRAVLDDAGGGRARRDGAREDAAVPPVEKVAV